MRTIEKIFIFIFLIIFLLASNILILRVFALGTDSPKNIPRVVLAELFVREGCLTCPTAEFCLEDLAWEYGTKKIILVVEHLWGDGYDTPETNARYNWYVGTGKKVTPDVFVDGLTRRLQGLACDCVDENYACYKKAIDEELTRLSLLELSAIKTTHTNPLTQGEREGEKVLNIIIEGTVKNISSTSLKDLAVCGMISKERGETGLYCCVQDIFPFQSIPLFLPGDSFNFRFVSELLVGQERDEENLHTIVFVQNLETKKVLQALYID